MGEMFKDFELIHDTVKSLTFGVPNLSRFSISNHRSTFNAPIISSLSFPHFQLLHRHHIESGGVQSFDVGRGNNCHALGKLHL